MLITLPVRGKGEILGQMELETCLRGAQELGLGIGLQSSQHPQKTAIPPWTETFNISFQAIVL